MPMPHMLQYAIAPCQDRLKCLPFAALQRRFSAKKSMDMQFARNQMVTQQVRAWDVLDLRVLAVFDALPREQFVPELYRRLAFADMQIPLPHSQVMMAPKVEGRLLQALDPQPDESALEIGTGSGFVTACLAKMAGEVLSVDIFPEFTDVAGKTLKNLGVHNAKLETRDGTQLDWLTQRFDIIAVTGSLPAYDNLYAEWLNLGGRLFVIVGQPPVMEALLITRVREDAWSRESLFET
ncbi:MAG: protein-L-isoaspartate O-methyltransferase family protein, partial [Gammaproteobacteria bacterium]